MRACLTQSKDEKSASSRLNTEACLTPTKDERSASSRLKTEAYLIPSKDQRLFSLLSSHQEAKTHQTWTKSTSSNLGARKGTEERHNICKQCSTGLRKRTICRPNQNGWYAALCDLDSYFFCFVRMLAQDDKDAPHLLQGETWK